MKDLYSFSANQESLDDCFERMYDAYCQVFTRCGLEYRAVEADAGAIGGNASKEFMVIASSGEDAVLYCENCAYAANVERAESFYEKMEQEGTLQPLEKVATPAVKTIEQLEVFLSCPPQKLIKTLFYQIQYREKEELIAVLIRGDRTANEVKIKNLLGCLEIELADPMKVATELHLPLGFVGPMGLTGKVRIFADREVMDLESAVIGANEQDYHFMQVNPSRDFPVDGVSDLRLVEAGDSCPNCQKTLRTIRGIEVGHIFKLGTKYSEALEANFLDENGKAKPFIMGCYGIGVGRTVAAAVEQNHDEQGIIWPMPIAPYQVVIIPVSIKDDHQRMLAEKLYQDCLAVGIEVLLDDRKERPGVKFKDADLIGIPLKVIIGPRATEENMVEVKIRRTGVEEKATVESVLNLLQSKIAEQLS